MDLFSSTGNWMVALGKTLIHSLWIALLVLSLLRLILHSIADRNSELRYRISVLSLLFFLGSVTSLFLLLFSPENQAQVSLSAGGRLFLSSFPLKDVIAVSAIKNPHLLFVLCTYLYFAGIPVVLIRSAASLRYLRKVKESGVLVQNEWCIRFEQLTRALGIRRKVVLMETKSLSAPGLIGLLKPIVMVPAGMFSNLSVAQVETILLHELYHLRRFDSLVNVIQLIIENLFFYNPGVSVMSKIIRNEREKCCDDRVIDACADPLSYAKALYQLAGQHPPFTHLVPGASGSDHDQLFTRINRILNQNAMKTNIREKLFSFLILAGGVLTMLTISGFTSSFSFAKGNDSWQKITFTDDSGEDPRRTSVFDTIPEVGDDVEIETEVDVDEEVDWEEIREEMQEAKQEALEALDEIDWEEIREKMEKARLHFDSVMMDVDFDFDFDMDIDIDKITEDVHKSLEGIDWEDLKEEMARTRIHLDSVFQELDLDFDADVDL